MIRLTFRGSATRVPRGTDDENARTNRLIACAALSSASALTIQIDYTYDTFSPRMLRAKTTLEKAAADLSHYLRATTISASAGEFVHGGERGLDYDAGLGSFVSESLARIVGHRAFGFSSSADTITIYAGMMPLVTGALGIGGPVRASTRSRDQGSSATWAGAVASAVDASNAGSFPRNGGSNSKVVDDSSTLGSATAGIRSPTGFLAG